MPKAVSFTFWPLRIAVLYNCLDAAEIEPLCLLEPLSLLTEFLLRLIMDTNITHCSIMKLKL